MSINLLGTSFIGSARGIETEDSFSAFDPRSGQPVDPPFFTATDDELSKAIELASRARIRYGKMSGESKARFLRQIAENIESLGDQLVERASLETGLPVARFQGERGRTCMQLRMFAELVENGSWVDARIDHAEPERSPVPKPDVRSMLRPVGPVAIFCASNFPLAFSVAGGDTASALAAGCPVVVIAHSAHPGTAELVGGAISAAAKTCDVHEGVFSLIFTSGYDHGQNLVKHSAIKAVGFTGSRSGGLALMKSASEREDPIPVYAEMSSINPTFILPSALASDYVDIAKGLFGSFTLGVGQFCTKPGLVILPESPQLGNFADYILEMTKEAQPAPLLTGGIQKAFEKGVGDRGENTGGATGVSDTHGFEVNPAVFQTNASYFLEDENLSEEIFGPTTLLVKTNSLAELLEIANRMEGQLTATILGDENDLKEYSHLIDVLETKVGRLIFNGFPTGVEVCNAMVHGGGFPATSDSRSTSVGSRAIERFSRLVCYQDFPQRNLPDELKDSNPLEIWRMVDGEIQS